MERETRKAETERETETTKTETEAQAEKFFLTAKNSQKKGGLRWIT
jgi:hypothetical protein